LGIPDRQPDDGVWVVVAAYNEGRRLGDTLQSLCGYCANVVVVDDGSADDTRDVALGFPVWVLPHLINCGQGAALQTGIDFALQRGAQVVVTFDADGQHAPEEIEHLVAPVRAGEVEVALGSRFLGRAVGLPWTRWLVLKLGILFTWAFSGIRVTDTHNGFRALSRQAAGCIRITQNRMAHASEILDQVRRQGMRFCEVPVTIHYSNSTLAKGQSSWNALKIVGQLLFGRLIR
jgi:glycosyltransferase involved in cell wall biosynthesis